MIYKKCVTELQSGVLKIQLKRTAAHVTYLAPTVRVGNVPTVTSNARWWRSALVALVPVTVVYSNETVPWFVKRRRAVSSWVAITLTEPSALGVDVPRASAWVLVRIFSNGSSPISGLLPL